MRNDQYSTDLLVIIVEFILDGLDHWICYFSSTFFFDGVFFEADNIIIANLETGRWNGWSLGMMYPP